MSTTDTTSLVAAIHASDLRMVIAVTGGGSGAIAKLLGVPGGSRTLLEAIVPYHSQALADFLGAVPEQFCSGETARAMAMAAFERATQLDPQATQSAGFSCTASLASDRPKRGAHRAYFAAQTLTSTTEWSIELLKGPRDRRGEEELVAGVLLSLIGRTAAVNETFAAPLLDDENIESSSIAAPVAWQELLAGSRPLVVLGDKSLDDLPKAVLAGAFNPLHHGHRRMAEIAAARLAGRCAFELSVTNVDKLPLDFLEIDQRWRQFDSSDVLLLTRAPTFAQKATLLPGSTFVVGADTIERVAQSRYYGGEAEMQQSLSTIADLGCRFLVFGRSAGDRFTMLEQLDLPPLLRAICDQVPQAEFDESISSTELRRQATDQHSKSF